MSVVELNAVVAEIEANEQQQFMEWLDGEIERLTHG